MQKQKTQWQDFFGEEELKQGYIEAQSVRTLQTNYIVPSKNTANSQTMDSGDGSDSEHSVDNFTTVD